MRVIILAMALLGAASAGNLGFGIKTGARVLSDIDSYAGHSESRPHVIGPTVEWAFRPRWSAELEALYRRNGYGATTSDFFGTYFARARANSWEFPMLLKSRPGHGLFIHAGYAVRAMQFHQTTQGVQTDIEGQPHTFSSVYAYPRQVSHGGVAGAGIELGSRRLRIAPEFRYTRWNNLPVDIQGSRGFTIQSTRNQAEILIGVRWQ